MFRAIFGFTILHSEQIDGGGIARRVLGRLGTHSAPNSPTSTTVSTKIPIFLDIEMTAVSNGDKVRIIPSSSDCGDKSSLLDDQIFTGCPGACMQASSDASDFAGIEIFTVNGNKSECDSNFVECGQAELKNITVLNATGAMLEFSNGVSSSVRVGDYIVVDPEILNCSSEAISVCGVLSGFWLLDTSPNPLVGNKVISIVSDTAVTVQIDLEGLESSLWGVSIIEGTSFDWEITSRARTKKDITRFAQSQGLKICHVSTNRFIGTVEFIDCARFDASTSLTPTSVIANTVVPSVLKVAHLPAESPSGSITFTLLMLNTDYVSIFFANGSRIENSGIFTCMQIFHNFLTFPSPAPTGCSIALYPKRQELRWWFDPQTNITIRFPDPFEVVIQSRQSQNIIVEESIQLVISDSSRPNLCLSFGRVLIGVQPIPPARLAADDLHLGTFLITESNLSSTGSFSASISLTGLGDNISPTTTSFQVSLPNWTGSSAHPFVPTLISSPHRFSSNIVVSSFGSKAFSFTLNSSGSFLFSGIKCPPSGLAPSPVYVTLTSNGQNPDFFVSTGKMLFCEPTRGYIVSTLGLAPSTVFQVSNTITIPFTLQIPFLLFGSGSTVTIIAPYGYTLQAASLAGLNASSCTQNTCTISLSFFDCIFHLSSGTVTMRAPDSPLIASDSRNVWLVQLATVIDNQEIPITSRAEPFIGISSVSIVSELPIFSVHIESHVASREVTMLSGNKGVMQSKTHAWVWFQTSTRLESRNEIFLQLPSDFSSTSPCTVLDAPDDAYYNIFERISEHASFCEFGLLNSSLIIHFDYPLKPDTKYLFLVSVINPILIGSSTTTKWIMTIRSDSSDLIEGSSMNVPVRFFDDKSLGNIEPSVQFNETVLSGNPFSVAIMIPPLFASTNVCLTLPVCMQWNGSSSNYACIMSSGVVGPLEIVYSSSDCMMSVPYLQIQSLTFASSIALPRFGGLSHIRIFSSSWKTGTVNKIEINFFSNIEYSDLQIALPSCVHATTVISASIAFFSIDFGSNNTVHISCLSACTPGAYSIVLGAMNSESTDQRPIFELTIDSVMTRTATYLTVGSFSIMHAMDHFSVQSNFGMQQGVVEAVRFFFSLSEDKLKLISGAQVSFTLQVFLSEDFEFPYPNCLQGLLTDTVSWPIESVVTGCVSNGHSAIINVSSGTDGFRKSVLYSFNIFIRVRFSNQDKIVLPDNKWRMQFDEDQVGEINSLPISTFSNASIAYSVKNFEGKNSVIFSFMVTHAIGSVSGGESLQICSVSGSGQFEIMAFASLEDVSIKDILDPGIDFHSIIYRSSTCIELVFSATYVLEPGHLFELILIAQNPSQTAAPWTIQSFKTAGHTPLDSVLIPSPLLYNSFSDFTVSGPNLFSGGESVYLVSAILFGVRIDPVDSIIFMAPKGYILDCESLTLLDQNFFNSACSDESINFLPKNLFIANSRFVFSINATLPFRTPVSVLENIFTVTHDRNGFVLEQSSLTGPQIIGRMTEIEMQIGPCLAAGSVTKMIVSFIPSSDAIEVKIGAVSPSGFDFASLSRNNSSHPIISSEGNSVRIEISVNKGIRAEIVLEGIKLPPITGPVLINMQSMDDRGNVKDQVLLFDVKIDVLARLTVEKLLVSGQRNSWLPAKFNDPEVLVSTLITLMNSKTSNILIPMNSLIVFRFNSINISSFHHSFSSESIFWVNFTAVPPSSNFSEILFQVYDPTGTHLIATNDKELISTDLQIVQDVTSFFNVSSSRSHTPPNTRVVVVLTFPADQLSFLIIAPSAFEFSKNCGIKIACDPIEKNFSSALVTVPDVSVGHSAQIIVQTPHVSPLLNDWYIAFLDSENRITSWGVTSGFSIDQMQDSRLVFPSIPQTSVQMAIGFKFSVFSFSTGSRVRVSLPFGFGIDSNLRLHASPNFPFNGTFLLQKNFIDIFLNDTLLESDYAFSFRVLTPSMTPRIDRSTSVEIFDQNLVLIDACYTLIVPPIVFGLPILPSIDSTLFERDDQSSVVTEFNLTTQQKSEVLRAQATAFREYFTFTIVGTVKVSEISRIKIRFPQNVVLNIAYFFKDPIAYGFMGSPEISNHVISAALNSDTASLTVTINGNWFQKVESFFFSIPVVLPQNIPLPAFNYFIISFGNDTNFFVEYPFLGHSLSDAPSSVLLDTFRNSTTTSRATSIIPLASFALIVIHLL